MQNDLREALDRLKMAAHVYEDDEMAADCATLEALLSARPLALGGQKGEDAPELALEYARDFGVGFIVDGKAVRPERVTVCHGDNSWLRQDTTPARAEAQDEGAAGEREAIIRAIRENIEVMGVHFIGHDDAADAILAIRRAHPSPPLAADEYRGMKAFKFINDLYRIKSEFPAIRLHGALKKAEALAALKSTAAKEGEKS